MIKKLLLFLISMLLIFSLTACDLAEFLPNNATSSESSKETDSSTTDNTVSSAPSTSSSEPVKVQTPTPAPKTPAKTTQKAAHTHSYSETKSAPTCTEKGYSTFVCSCGHTYKDNYVDPQHTFVDYRCSYCGKVDTNNLFYLLKKWVLKYGKTNGDIVSYDITNTTNSDGYTFITGLSYTPSNDFVYFDTWMRTPDDINTEILFFIPKEFSENYTYGCGLFLPDDYDSILSCQGKIFAPEYTENAPISCENFKGSMEYRLKLVEYTRINLNSLLYEIENFLIQNELGFSIKDMGFTSFLER